MGQEGMYGREQKEEVGEREMVKERKGEISGRAREQSGAKG